MVGPINNLLKQESGRGGATKWSRDKGRTTVKVLENNGTFDEIYQRSICELFGTLIIWIIIKRIKVCNL